MPEVIFFGVVLSVILNFGESWRECFEMSFLAARSVGEPRLLWLLGRSRETSWQVAGDENLRGPEC